jgi:phosphoribosylaminoimidazolecarboxamide formyltransferase/IMP cyclohydrolase
VTVARALLSAYDKTGLVPFAEGLQALGVELVASGGTASVLAEAGLPVTAAGELTGFDEMLGHRVVTLHPAIHGGILARRDVPEDVADLERHGIGPIDLVCVNLYPFEQTVAHPAVAWHEAIEQIDVGGPAMLRAAAKNHEHVVPLCRPEDYDAILRELRETGGVSEATRRQLALRAFATTAAYDAAVARWLGRGDDFPDLYVPAFDRVLELAYGENPHQRAAFYAERGAGTHLLAGVEQRHGKPLSYNNPTDRAAARTLAEALPGPACVIVKHANPCGVAVAGTIDEAYGKALAADPVSAYGGVVVLTEPVGQALGGALADQFVEVLLAPAYDEAALAALTEKPATRILEARERRAAPTSERDLRRVPGGLLVQDRDPGRDGRAGMDVVCGELDETAWADLLLAWEVVGRVTSNAVVLARDGMTVGIGAGQMSRVDAVRIAVAKAQELGHGLGGAVLASDAFFPFPDGPQLALDAGVSAVIQPGGSKRDDEVVSAVRDAGAAMVFTGRRHFRH